MRRETLLTDKLPAPKGPYSQAVRAGDLLFLSGYGPFHPRTGAVVRGTFEEQVRLALDNISTLLQEAGTSLANVVKTTVYLLDMDNFPILNRVYAEYFPAQPPARTTIQAARLPFDISVEIDAVAVMPEG